MNIPPQATDVESVIIGVLLLHRDAIDTVSMLVKPECFYLDKNQRVIRTIFQMAIQGQPIDIITVIEALKKTNELEIVGGAYELTKYTNSVVSAANVENYCRIILEKYMLREMISLGYKLTSEGFMTSSDPFDMLDSLEKKVSVISANHLNTDMTDISTALMNSLKRIETWRTIESSVTGVPSKLFRLDNLTRGFQPGDLIVLAARPSFGKTALALQIAKDCGVPVAFFCLEMKTDYLVIRLMAAEGEMNLTRLLSGRLDDMQMKMLYDDAVQILAKKEIFFSDQSDLSPFLLKSKLRKMCRKFKIKFAIIDYLQLMSVPGKKTTREQEVSIISRELKKLAGELNIPILALSQLSREVEKRKGRQKVPVLSDLRESGAIEQDADVVIFGWGPEDDEIAQDASLFGKKFLKVSKQRNGALGIIELEFKGDIQVFREMPENRLKMAPEGFVPINITEPRKKADKDDFPF